MIDRKPLRIVLSRMDMKSVIMPNHYLLKDLTRWQSRFVFWLAKKLKVVVEQAFAEKFEYVDLGMTRDDPKMIEVCDAVINYCNERNKNLDEVFVLCGQRSLNEYLAQSDADTFSFITSDIGENRGGLQRVRGVLVKAVPRLDGIAILELRDFFKEVKLL